MKTAFHVVGERVSRHLILEALTAPSGGFGRRLRPAASGLAVFVAIGLFILAAITDALAGYLARRWEVVSTFGRLMDPFCDKVLVLGAFIYLAGPRFVVPRWVDGDNVRYFEFDGDDILKLSLKDDSGRITATLTWRRLK